MYRRIWNEEIETLSAEATLALEREALARQLDYVYARSPFYRAKFEQAGLRPGDIRHREELARLPFTTKAELRASQDREPPFGDYLAASPESVNRVHRTSGATGRFLYTALTRSDLKQTNECGARAFWAAGLRPCHTVVHTLNYCLWMGGYTDHSNLETTGAAVVPFGVRNARQLVTVIKEVQANAISGTPSYPDYLESIVRTELGIEPAELGLRLGLFGGEPGLENRLFKQRLEATWGMRAANANYGMSDVLCTFASVCDEVDDLHFLAQGALIAQLVDPVAATDLPLAAGVKGELVLTNLEREAQPLVRYRTHDVIEVLVVEPCRCRRTGFRFRMIGRSDDMLHVKGINVFPAGVSTVLQRLVPAVTGEFQIVLSHPGPYDHLDILVEHGAQVGPAELPALRERISKLIGTELTFSACIRLVPPQSIARTEMGKAKRVVKEYQENVGRE